MKHILYLIIAIAFFIVPVIAQAQDSTAKAETKPAVKAEQGAITVLEAKLGTDVKDREVTGEDSSFTVGAKVWFWFKVKGAANDSLTVIWKCGNFTKELKLAVGGSPFRTWAAKTVAKAGDWTVTVSDASGNALKELKFTVK
jgi:hypothetical protein